MWGKTSFPPPVHSAGSGEAERGLQPAPPHVSLCQGTRAGTGGGLSPLLVCVRWRTRILPAWGP